MFAIVSLADESASDLLVLFAVLFLCCCAESRLEEGCSLSPEGITEPSYSIVFGVVKKGV